VRWKRVRSNYRFKRKGGGKPKVVQPSQQHKTEKREKLPGKRFKKSKVKKRKKKRGNEKNTRGGRLTLQGFSTIPSRLLTWKRKLLGGMPAGNRKTDTVGKAVPKKPIEWIPKNFSLSLEGDSNGKKKPGERGRKNGEDAVTQSHSL